MGDCVSRGPSRWIRRPGQLAIRLLLADTTTLRKLSQLGDAVRSLVRLSCVIILVVGCCAAQDVSSQPANPSKNRASRGLATTAADPKPFFMAGETALRNADLSLAEREFRRVLSIDPRSAGAYANLGVIHMRRKEWDPALRMLRKADSLAPTVAGIRLNIGLTYYRQNDFRSAIAPFESVLRDQPDSVQARYLLGLCYFFNDRWADAVDTLQPLWGQQSLNINYLYVLAIAAHKAGRAEIDERAISRMSEIGKDTPEFHLLMGKAHLNNEEDDKALAEFARSEKGDPKLPFLHFNIGLAYLHKQDYERAAQEFKQDIALEPDVAFNYDKLGTVYAFQDQDAEAEKSFRQALRLDAHLVTSQLGLARIYQKQEKYPAALAALAEVDKMSPENYTAHYLRGQVLQRMGQREKAKAEFDTYTHMMNSAREKRGRELSGEIPNPELTKEPE
ncbi:MAG TPA: tetratricopeptide repeat protein [Terriglobales bacterium]|nr:tetratricopeptide repeat protein [Terriglobales bacterium]